MGKGSSRTPNDQRSDAKNPTSAEYRYAMDNRSVQLNSKDTVSKGSKK